MRVTGYYCPKKRGSYGFHEYRKEIRGYNIRNR